MAAGFELEEKSDCKFKQQDYVLFEGEAAGAGKPKAGKRSDGLLEIKKLGMQVDEGAERERQVGAKVAKLEARLKDAEAAAQPAPSPKVMRTICFRSLIFKNL